MEFAVSNIFTYLEETIFKKVKFEKKIIFSKRGGEISQIKMHSPNTIHLLAMQSLIEYNPSFSRAVPN